MLSDEQQNQATEKSEKELRAILAEMLSDYEHLVQGGNPANEAKRARLIARARRCLERKEKP